MMEIPLTASANPGNTQNIGELWESLYKYAKARHEDNQLYNGKYPIETRRMQMSSLNSLIEDINKFHKEVSMIKPSMVCNSCGHIFTDSFKNKLSIKTTNMCCECVKLFGQW